MKPYFRFDERLRIPVPDLEREWETYSRDEQQEMIVQWEAIRARIPEVIRELEDEIDRRQQQASETDDWEAVCRLYAEIADLASRINDLNILYRTEPELAEVFERRESIGAEHVSREK
ncbi:MAG: hypothetical protein QJR06_05530 [Alicyclobacillaceae bacterium]|nr:hypothetical protein [Alicyclobacillaceae bacterium]